MINFSIQKLKNNVLIKICFLFIISLNVLVKMTAKYFDAFFTVFKKWKSEISSVLLLKEIVILPEKVVFWKLFETKNFKQNSV